MRNLLALVLSLALFSCAGVPADEDVITDDLSVVHQATFAVVYPDTLWMTMHIRSITNGTWTPTSSGFGRYLLTTNYALYSYQSTVGPTMGMVSNASTCNVGCVGGVCGKWICGSTIYTCPSIDYMSGTGGTVFYGPGNGVYTPGWYNWPSNPGWYVGSQSPIDGQASTKTGAPGNWTIICQYPVPSGVSLFRS